MEAVKQTQHNKWNATIQAKSTSQSNAINLLTMVQYVEIITCLREADKKNGDAINDLHIMM